MPAFEDHRARDRAWISGLGPLLVILDEDRRFSGWLRATLEAARYRCLEFQSYADAAPNWQAMDASAVVLDLATPELARLTAIEGIRRSSDVPILVVSERADEREQAIVCALDAGADDYLHKPLAAGEFLARVRVALRHGRARRGSHDGLVRAGNLRIDLLSREVILNGARIDLTPTDYKLLALLARNLGRVVERERLLHEAWGPHARDPHYLRVYMARLRQKLDPARTGTRYIVTETAVGYRLLVEPQPSKTHAG